MRIVYGPIARIAFLATCVLLVIPKPAHAVPAFSRRYNVKCYACHTVPPVLNQAGYMFKRLGYHFPPALEDKRVVRLIDLIRSEPAWNLENTASFAVADVGYTSTKTTQEGQPSNSSSSINLSAWNAYWTGYVPNTQFWYYSEFDIVTNGDVSPEVTNANFGYTGGSASSSWYVKAGRSHLSVAEGTRGAAVYSVLPTAPLLLETVAPTNFILDQSPVGVGAGYTWASPRYKNIVAASVEVTNGDNADGSEILGNSSKNAKDVWFDADWWFAPESGVSFIDYYGRKFQNQNDGLPNQFTYYPTLRRQGLFGNYMVASKVDLLGGYLHSRDDWQDPATGTPGIFQGNDSYGEADYYIRTGLVAAVRYDRLRQFVTGGPGRQGTRQWTVGVEKALTPSGNIVGRLGYTDQVGRDPLAAVRSTSKSVQADVAFNF